MIASTTKIAAAASAAQWFKERKRELDSGMLMNASAYDCPYATGHAKSEPNAFRRGIRHFRPDDRICAPDASFPPDKLAQPESRVNMRVVYLANVYAHILAAMVWIGGSSFIALVLAPLMRRRDGADDGLLRAAALRFRTVGWISLAILIATGSANLAFRGIGLSDLLSGAAFRGATGHALACKLSVFAVLLAISGLHDFRWGPQAARALQTDRTSPAAIRGRRWAARVGRSVFFLGLVIVAAAVLFVRGGL